jgi:hypothetical protein
MTWTLELVSRNCVEYRSLCELLPFFIPTPKENRVDCTVMVISLLWVTRKKSSAHPASPGRDLVSLPRQAWRN